MGQDCVGWLSNSGVVPSSHSKEQKGTFKSQWENHPVKPLQAALEMLSRRCGVDGPTEPSGCSCFPKGAKGTRPVWMSNHEISGAGAEPHLAPGLLSELFLASSWDFSSPALLVVSIFLWWWWPSSGGARQGSLVSAGGAHNLPMLWVLEKRIWVFSFGFHFPLVFTAFTCCALLGYGM